MRTHRTLSRRFRTIMGALLSLAVVAVGGIPVSASHHQTGEAEPAAKPKPAPSRIIKIKPASHVMLAGNRVVLVAKICNKNGKKCRPAKSAKWRIKPDGLAALTSRRGAVSVVESLGRPGELEVTLKQDGATGSATITVADEAPEVEAEVLREDLALYSVPESVSVLPGAGVRLVAWGCPIDTATELGANGIPDGTDDACEPLQIHSVVVGDREPVLVQLPFGSEAVVQWWPSAGAPGDDDDGLAAVQLVTDAGVAVVELSPET